MDHFRRIVYSALIAGLLAGVALSLVQRFQVIPLVLEAETYEAVAAQSQAHGQGPYHGHTQSSLVRSSFTVLANTLIGIAFALLLVAAYTLRPPGNMLQGLCWGLGGFVVFFVAPALGMPPELPGMQAAPLAERQAWWRLSVSCAAVALALITLQRRWFVRFLGAAMLFIPFLSGAPEAPTGISNLPAQLPQQFFWATACANLVFWLVLGLATTWLYKRGGERGIV